MSGTQRLSLARQAYEAAIGLVRRTSTPRTWARLLRAARNLREASGAAEAKAHGGRSR